MKFRDRIKLARYLRTHSDPEDQQCARENAATGIDLDFRLPYQYPRNEHEDGMNLVAVLAARGRPVMSGRSDW